MCDCGDDGVCGIVVICSLQYLCVIVVCILENISPSLSFEHDVRTRLCGHWRKHGRRERERESPRLFEVFVRRDTSDDDGEQQSDVSQWLPDPVTLSPKFLKVLVTYLHPECVFWTLEWCVSEVWSVGIVFCKQTYLNCMSYLCILHVQVKVMHWMHHFNVSSVIPTQVICAAGKRGGGRGWGQQYATTHPTLESCYNLYLLSICIPNTWIFWLSQRTCLLLQVHTRHLYIFVDTQHLNNLTSSKESVTERKVSR